MKRVLSFMLVCTLSQVLENIRPGALWVVREGTKLEWLDNTQAKPTEDEINMALQSCEKTPIITSSLNTTLQVQEDTADSRLSDLENRVTKLEGEIQK